MIGCRACVTFDVDLVDYGGTGEPIDELAAAWPAIRAVFDRHPHWTATWCVRLDDQIGFALGDPAALFERHAGTIAELRARGHELAWHPHAYVRRRDGRWEQNIDDGAVAEEVARLAPLAAAHHLRVVRMGWGFHSNLTMRAVADAGFAVDSSAIPRPRYAWETSRKDWTITPRTPYRPSVDDYRVPGPPSLPLLEIPMSVAAVAAPYDDGVVLRYLNPAFHSGLWSPALEGWLDEHDHVVTVTHPYELLPGRSHGLIAYDPRAFEINVCDIERRAQRAGTVRFMTLSEFAAHVNTAS